MIIFKKILYNYRLEKIKYKGKHYFFYNTLSLYLRILLRLKNKS